LFQKSATPQKIVGMNVDISETIKDRELGSQKRGYLENYQR